MKKIGRLFLIIGFSFILSGCSKKVVTTDNFKNILKNEGMAIYDMTSRMPSESNIKEATIGSKGDEWKVEYYIFEDLKSATSVYETNEEKFKTAKNTESTNSKYDDNYAKFEVNTDENYMVVIRNKNSVLYTIVNKKYKDDLNKIIKKMDY